MNLKETYNKYKSTLACSNLPYLEDLRKNLINSYDLSPKKLKQNESTKHFDTSILKNFTFTPPNNNYFSPFVNYDKKNIQSFSENEKLYLKNFKKYQNVLEDDYLVNLNTIFQNSGFVLDLMGNNKSKIYINNKNDEENSVFSKNYINVNENCESIILESFNNKVSNMNIINYFDLKKNSKIIHFVFQENQEQASLQYTNYINCEERAEYKQIIFNSSNCSIRNHNYANLLGEFSRADLQGFFLANGNQIIDNKTVVNHYAPFCTSDQKYKGILTDNSKASYLSKTYVNEKAQKTEAYQLSKGILLSENSYFHSKPELKIYADDVKCSHGSTIGPFDQNILFYCRSRGISKTDSVSLLINSFFSDILENINDKEYLTLVRASLNNWLERSSY